MPVTMNPREPVRTTFRSASRDDAIDAQSRAARIVAANARGKSNSFCHVRGGSRTLSRSICCVSSAIF